MTASIHVAGWTLVHFVWQGALVGLVAAAALRLLRSASAQTRYVVACGALAAMLAAPSSPRAFCRLPIPLARRSMYCFVPSHRHSVTCASAPRGRVPSRHGLSMQAAGAGLDAILPLVVTAWFAGVAFLLVRLAGGWWRVRRLHRDAIGLASSRWQAVSERIASRLGVHRRVHVVDSPRVDTPTALGWLRPVVLLPIAALTTLAPAQVEAILAHELAHIRRHDYAVNVLQTIAETLLFYHPAVWWVSARIRAEREHCCDDVAVDVCGDAVDYAAAALTELETWRTARTALTLAATDGSLLARVRRVLLGRVNEEGRSSAATATVTLALLLAMLVGGLPRLSASQPTPRRPAGRRRAIRGRRDGNTRRGRSLSRQAILLAFDLAGNWGMLQLAANGQTLRIILKIPRRPTLARCRDFSTSSTGRTGSPSVISLRGTTWCRPGLNETYPGTARTDRPLPGSLTQGASPMILPCRHPRAESRASGHGNKEIPATHRRRWQPTRGWRSMSQASAVRPACSRNSWASVAGRSTQSASLSVSDLISLRRHRRTADCECAVVGESETTDISAAPESASQPTRPQALSDTAETVNTSLQLTLHREKRELPVYALTVARSGPKLTQNDSSWKQTIGPSLPGGLAPCQARTRRWPNSPR